MAERFKWLRDSGDWGGRLATLLGFLLTNWTLTLAGLVGIWVGLSEHAREFAQTPAVYVGAGTFLFLLWMLIGLTYLVDRRKPRETRTHQDYRYGLTFEGCVPQFIPADAGVPMAGCLALGFQLRNYCPGPIYYQIESADIRLANRATPKYKPNKVVGYMARGGGRTGTPGSFEAKEIKDFYGAGLIEGTADVAFVYGPPGEPPTRRLKLNLEIAVMLPKDGILNPLEQGHNLGFNANIALEEDEAI